MNVSYLIRRLLQGLLTIFSTIVIVFFVTRLVSDPARKALGVGATTEQVDAYRELLGLNRPLWVQLEEFVSNTLTLQFGTSISRDVPAMELVLQSLPKTLTLLAAGLVLAVVIAVPLGMVAALRPGSAHDNVIVTASLAALSLPQFWFGAILILLFAVHFGVLPTSGSDGPKWLVLPTIALALPVAGRIAQVVRSSTIDELQKPYVLAARARGFSRSEILSHQVLRNAAVPISSFIGLETAAMLGGGTVLVETVFGYNGLGRLAVNAALADDIVLLQSIVLVVATLVVGINLLSDLLSSLLNPRIRQGLQ
jgi:peptide/nickel transport system permease protein